MKSCHKTANISLYIWKHIYIHLLIILNTPNSFLSFNIQFFSIHSDFTDIPLFYIFVRVLTEWAPAPDRYSHCTPSTTDVLTLLHHILLVLNNRFMTIFSKGNENRVVSNMCQNTTCFCASF